MSFYNYDSDRDPNDLTEEKIKKITEEKLKELAEEQQEYYKRQAIKEGIPEYGNGKSKSTKHKNKEDQEKEDDNKKPTYPINKYSQGIPLAEAVLIDNIPYFIQIIGEDKPILSQKIELSDIDIVPPERTEYLSKEYIFNSFEEVQYFINLAKQETLDSLKTRVKTILQKYIDIDDDFITILAADIIFTYFQDRLKMTHYLLIVGDNNTGKSNILLVFSFLGYRPILDTAITPANIYNFGSQIEEGQCIIIEDEIDDIDLQEEKKKLYKVSYRGGTKVTRMYESNNLGPMNSKNKRKSSDNRVSFCLDSKCLLLKKCQTKSNQKVIWKE